MKNYNEILKGLRNDNDIKQETVAKYLNITKQQYSLYETGQREFKVHHIIKLCEYYKVSADYVLGISYEYNRPKR